jgi:hypothetical protein
MEGTIPVSQRSILLPLCSMTCSRVRVPWLVFPGRSYTYSVAGNLDLASSGNGLDADGVKLFCAKVRRATTR